MTYYRENSSGDVNNFFDITKSQVSVISPNGTTNRIENPSFEIPTYQNGVLGQYNWGFVTTINSPSPVTTDHAYSGSFAWKARLNLNTDSIYYGKSRGIQPTVEDSYHDILSFYCYGVIDGKSTVNGNQDYAILIPSNETTYRIYLYGTSTSNASDSTRALIDYMEFVLTPLPKDTLGDITKGLSGSQVPYFFPWKRVVYDIPDAAKEYKYLHFEIRAMLDSAPSLYDNYLVVDAFQMEKQEYSVSATMYFDGTYEGFNTKQYPLDFQWTGAPHASMSIRSQSTRVNGRIVSLDEYCGFYLKEIEGLSTRETETKTYTRTFQDGQYLVDQVVRNAPITLNGRIIADNATTYMEYFARFQELIGKQPYTYPQPTRLMFSLAFSNGLSFLPVYSDVVYKSGLEMDTSGIFQGDVSISFDVVSTHFHYQNDSSSNMFNDSPLFDQFNTMNVDILRDIGGFIYYNKTEEKWETPSNIGFFKSADSNYTSTLQYGGGTTYQRYDTKTSYTVGDVHVVTEDADGIIWIGGQFDIVEIDGYYVGANSKKVDIRLSIRVNNIVGIRKKAMTGTAYVLPTIPNVAYVENGPDLTPVSYITDWQVIVLLDAPTRYSQSAEYASTALIGIPNSGSVVYAIEITPSGSIFVGGLFTIDIGDRTFKNFMEFYPYGSDAQNVNLYIPSNMYSYASLNYTSVQLKTTQGMGIYRTNWVNSATPYAKYGVYREAGFVGRYDQDNSPVYDIKYDTLNNCLYLGGVFTSVSNYRTPYSYKSVGRLVKYDIATRSFVNLNASATFGVEVSNLDPVGTIFIKKLLVQYAANGVNIIAVGKFKGAGTATSSVDTWGIASFFISPKDNNVATTEQTGGGGYQSSADSQSATFYDVISTPSQRVYVSGNFNRVNRAITPVTRVTGMAEYSNGSLIDMTKGVESSYYRDSYQDIPTIVSMSPNSDEEIYIVGNFTNVKNRAELDGVAKWDGRDYYGVGLYFTPTLTKLLQRVYLDNSDNVYLFTGPNTQQSTIVRALDTDLSNYTLPTNINVVWRNLDYPALQAIFKEKNINIEFLSRTPTAGGTTTVSGKVNAVVRVCPDIPPASRPNPRYATQETLFIGGRFDFIKIGDTMFRVNNLVALRYDQNENPFPYKVLTFSNGVSPYYDWDTGGRQEAYIGIPMKGRNGVIGPAIYSIDVHVVQKPNGAYVPTNLYVGGKFDFDANGYSQGDIVSSDVRVKNFLDIELQLNDAETDLKFNVPTNNELNISVPYMNYGYYRSPGLCGTDGTNDTVYTVKSTYSGFQNTTEVDPGLVFIGGDFTTVSSNGTTMPARRIAVYTRSVAWGQASLTLPKRLYKIDYTQNANAAGIQASTAWSTSVSVRSLEYTDWQSKITTPSALTSTTSLIIGGQFSNATNSFVSGSYTLSTGVGLMRLGIITPSKSTPFPSSVQPTALTGAAPIVNDLAYNNHSHIGVVGDFTSGAYLNALSMSGSKANDSLTLGPFTSLNLGYVFAGTAAFNNFKPKYIEYNDVSDSFIVTGGTSSNNLFKDTTAILYASSPDNILYPANYAYSNVNVPQAGVIGTGVGDVKQAERRLLQTHTGTTGRALPLEVSSSNIGEPVLIPLETNINTLYTAIPTQTFNCYNTGTTSSYPTITFYSPFKGNYSETSYLHVITNVTTKQSIFLNLFLRPGEVIRVRTDRERISVISNISGDISNAILSSKNIQKSKIEDAQIFRLIPGKNVIRYGPMLPKQRYFRSDSIYTSMVYNNNQNAVVPPIVVALSWTISFNTMNDAIYSTVNPLLL